MRAEFHLTDMVQLNLSEKAASRALMGEGYRPVFILMFQTEETLCGNVGRAQTCSFLDTFEDSANRGLWQIGWRAVRKKEEIWKIL